MKCVWIALTAARFLLASDFALQEYLPPDTKVVMGLRVRALTESSLFQENSESAKKMSEGWTKLVAFTGFDPLHDVDEVLLTSPADRDNAPALLVVRGRFNLEKLGASKAGAITMASPSTKTAAAAQACSHCSTQAPRSRAI